MDGSYPPSMSASLKTKQELTLCPMSSLQTLPHSKLRPCRTPRPDPPHFLSGPLCPCHADSLKPGSSALSPSFLCSDSSRATACRVTARLLALEFESSPTWPSSPVLPIPVFPARPLLHHMCQTLPHWAPGNWVSGGSSQDGILGTSETILTCPARHLGSCEGNCQTVPFPGCYGPGTVPSTLYTLYH